MYFQLFRNRMHGQERKTYWKIAFHLLKRGKLWNAFFMAKNSIKYYSFKPEIQFEVKLDGLTHKIFHAIYGKLSKEQIKTRDSTIGKSDILKARIYENKRTISFQDEGGFADTIRFMGLHISIGGTGFESDPLYFTISKPDGRY